MAKPDPALLDPVNYHFSCDLDTRFTDVDVNQHVNNVAIVEIMQEARVRFHRACDFDKAVAGMTAMTVSFSVEYLGEAKYETALANHVGMLSIGRTSHTVGQLITQQDRVVAFGRAVIVCVSDGRPVENPPAFAEAAKPWMIAA